MRIQIPSQIREVFKSFLAGVDQKELEEEGGRFKESYMNPCKGD